MATGFFIACGDNVREATTSDTRQLALKPSTSRRQFLLFAAACRDPAFAKRRGINRRVACENFMADMRRACRNEKHARLIGVTQSAACRRVRQGLTRRKEVLEFIRDMLLGDLDKDDISVDDLATGGGLLNPDQGKPCPRGQIREPVTGRCVPKKRKEVITSMFGADEYGG